MDRMWVKAPCTRKRRGSFSPATRGDFLLVHHTLTPDRKSSHSAAAAIVGAAACQCVSARGALLHPDTARRRRLNGRNHRPPTASSKITHRRSFKGGATRRRLSFICIPVTLGWQPRLQHDWQTLHPNFPAELVLRGGCLLKFRVAAPRQPATIVRTVAALLRWQNANSGRPSRLLAPGVLPSCLQLSVCLSASVLHSWFIPLLAVTVTDSWLLVAQTSVQGWGSFSLAAFLNLMEILLLI